MGICLTETRGTCVVHHIFKRYETYRGAIEGRRSGVSSSFASCDAVADTICVVGTALPDVYGARCARFIKSGSLVNTAALGT